MFLVLAVLDLCKHLFVFVKTWQWRGFILQEDWEESFCSSCGTDYPAGANLCSSSSRWMSGTVDGWNPAPVDRCWQSFHILICRVFYIIWVKSVGRGCRMILMKSNKFNTDLLTLVFQAIENVTVAVILPELLDLKTQPQHDWCWFLLIDVLFVLWTPLVLLDSCCSCRGGRGRRTPPSLSSCCCCCCCGGGGGGGGGFPVTRPPSPGPENISGFGAEVPIVASDLRNPGNSGYGFLDVFGAFHIQCQVFG